VDVKIANPRNSTSPNGKLVRINENTFGFENCSGQQNNSPESFLKNKGPNVPLNSNMYPFLSENLE